MRRILNNFCSSLKLQQKYCLVSDQLFVVIVVVVVVSSYFNYLA